MKPINSLYFKLLLLTTCLTSVSCSGSGVGKSPSFLGYSVESGMTVAKHSQKSQKRILRANNNETSEDSEVITDSMYGNKDERVVITLQFINQERDNFIDLVLNDSDYGNDQVYELSSKTNIVHSVETRKSDGKWITDVTILMPKTKSSTTRNIEITEVNFLKTTINKQVHAELNKDSFSKKLDVKVTEKFVPTSKVFFQYDNFSYNGEEGIQITKLREEYGVPNVVYIPSYIDSLPVLSCANAALDTVSYTLKHLIIPETMKYHEARMAHGAVEYSFTVLAQDVKNISNDPDDSLAGFYQYTKLYLTNSYYSNYYEYLHYYCMTWEEYIANNIPEWDKLSPEMKESEKEAFDNCAFHCELNILDNLDVSEWPVL
ncbi:MAG: hypothetical protein SOZ65_04085 [Erysipelotrichaceae bacterium]|nr:hypothetical protein [Erysipelotrichaceae bacterium]